MTRKATGWTCRRKACKFKNPPRTRKCQKCGHPRPARRIPAHQQVLRTMKYEDFVEINGGDFCWLCEQLPVEQRIKTTRNYDRDHDHITGQARGLLCHWHNRRLGSHLTLELARAIVAYLERAASR